MKTQLQKFDGKLTCTINHIAGISQAEIDAVVAALVSLGWSVIA